MITRGTPTRQQFSLFSLHYCLQACQWYIFNINEFPDKFAPIASAFQASYHLFLLSFPDLWCMLSKTLCLAITVSTWIMTRNEAYLINFCGLKQVCITTDHIFPCHKAHYHSFPHPLLHTPPNTYVYDWPIDCLHVRIAVLSALPLWWCFKRECDRVMGVSFAKNMCPPWKRCPMCGLMI